MRNFDVERFVIPTRLHNTDNHHRLGDPKCDTIDYIFIDSIEDPTGPNASKVPTNTYQTYWSLMMGSPSRIRDTSDMDGFRPAASKVGLRSTSTCYSMDCRSGIFGNISQCSPEDDYVSYPMSMHLDINAVIQARKESDENFKIYPVQYDDGQIYYVMEAGEFPRNEYVGRWYNEKFETHLEDEKSNVLLPTGMKCLGGITKDGDPIWCDEYKYCGGEYVRTMLNRGNYKPEEQSSTIEGAAGSGPLSGLTKLLGKGADTDKWGQFPTNTRKPQWVWIKKEPLRWIIRNWDDMPKEINPNGNGNAGYIDLRTEEGIVNLPFGSMHWQSSPIRAYCNGYTREQMQNNGNPQMFLPSTKIPDFTQQNFMSFVFGSDMGKVYRRDDVAAQKNDKHSVPNGQSQAFSGGLSKSEHWFGVAAKVLDREIKRRGLGKVGTEENETADYSPPEME